MRVNADDDPANGEASTVCPWKWRIEGLRQYEARILHRVCHRGLCYREFHDGSGEKHVAAHLRGALAPHTPHFLGPRARTCGTGLERSFRPIRASGTACSSTDMRPPGVHSGVPAFSGTQWQFVL